VPEKAIISNTENFHGIVKNQPKEDKLSEEPHPLGGVLLLSVGKPE
jgi:hypothetical protein